MAEDTVDRNPNGTVKPGQALRRGRGRPKKEPKSHRTMADINDAIFRTAERCSTKISKAELDAMSFYEKSLVRISAAGIGGDIKSATTFEEIVRRATATSRHDNLRKLTADFEALKRSSAVAAETYQTDLRGHKSENRHLLSELKETKRALDAALTEIQDLKATKALS